MRGTPGPLLVLAIVLAAAATIGMAYVAGWHRVLTALSGMTAGWLVIALAAQLAALIAYVPSYHTIASVEGGVDLRWRTTVKLVLAGFGAFVPVGGFGYDRRVLRHLDDEGCDPGARIIGLGALEYAVLAPAAWIAAIVLIAQRSGVQGAVLWSWAICFPIGTVLALLALRHRDRLTRHGRRRRTDEALTGLQHLFDVITAHHAVLGYGGMLGYWIAEGVSLYAAGRALGIVLGLGQIILALGTGYVLTRRSMPLAGAGAMMVLMSLALHWVGISLVTAVAMVVVYHLAGLILPSLAALWARHALEQRVHPAT